MAEISVYDFVYNLQDIGVYDVILPFILVFAIMYALLNKIKIFGTGTGVRAVNIVVALVFALLILLPEYGIVDRINLYLPRFAFIIILLVTGMILLGFLGRDVEHGLQGWLFGLVLLVSIAGLIAVNSDIFPKDTSFGYFLSDNAWTIGTIIVVIVILAMIVGFGGSENNRINNERVDRAFGLGGNRGNP